jgi:hypothetical protein
MSPITFVPKSGSKPANFKATVPQSPASVRPASQIHNNGGKKGTQNPRHFHITPKQN